MSAKAGAGCETEWRAERRWKEMVRRLRDWREHRIEEREERVAQRIWARERQ